MKYFIFKVWSTSFIHQSKVVHWSTSRMNDTSLLSDNAHNAHCMWLSIIMQQPAAFWTFIFKPNAENKNTKMFQNTKVIIFVNGLMLWDVLMVNLTHRDKHIITGIIDGRVSCFVGNTFNSARSDQCWNYS